MSVKKSAREKILIVEDEKDLVRLLRYNLERERFRVVAANDAESGLELARKSKPDLIILDIMLPKMDGLDFLRHLRKESQVPVMFLTAKRSELDRILGLKLGADDYIVKPFSMGEINARVEAVLRRARTSGDGGGPAAAFTLGALSVDFERHEVRVKGKPAKLAPKEFAILKLLIEAKGKVLSRDHLLEQIWGHEQDMGIDTRTVDQHIARLRRKLGFGAELISTVTNFGYKLGRFSGRKP